MSDSIEKLKKYVNGNPSCMKALKDAKSRSEVIDHLKVFAKAAGIPLTEQEITDAFSKPLSEEELGQISGGTPCLPGINCNGCSGMLCG